MAASETERPSGLGFQLVQAASAREGEGEGCFPKRVAGNPGVPEEAEEGLAKKERKRKKGTGWSPWQGQFTSGSPQGSLLRHLGKPPLSELNWG